MCTTRWKASVLLVVIILAGCNSTQRGDYEVLSKRSDRLIAQLDNGLVVMAQRMTAAPVVSVQCYVKTGSIYEQEFVGLGLSHFLEHLVSGGTTAGRTEAQSNELLGRMGAQTNAGTGLDNVSYYINTSSDHATTAVDLLSDWMQHSLIRQEEFDRERDVIGREFAMGRGEPSRIFWKLTQAARFPPNHPARHPTIGYEDEFVTVTREQVHDFYRRMYVPNNMVFVVVGDIDPRAIVEQVSKLWAGSRPAELPRVVLPNEAPLTEPRELTGNADIDRPRLRMSWVGTEHATPEDYALDLLARILGQGELSRLTQRVRNERGLVTSIDAGNWSFHWGDGMFVIDAVPEKGKMDEAKAEILDVIQRVALQGITDDELRRAKNKTVAEMSYATQTAQDTAERLAQDFLSVGDPDYMMRYVEAIGAVTAQQVQQAAQKFLRPDRLITVRLEPEQGPPRIDKRPADAPRGQVLTEGPDTRSIALDNDVLVRKMLALQAATQEVQAPDVERLSMHRLPNGLRVIVQRNTRLPIVALQWYHLGGLLADEPGREGVGNAMAQMLMRGAGDRTADEIALELESIGAMMGSDAASSTFTVTAQCLSKDWPRVMGIMADVIRRPTFPPQEWERMKPRLLAAIDSVSDTWYGELRIGFRQAYFGDHPWSQTTLGRREVVESLTPEQLGQYHARHIAARDAVLAIVGNVEVAEVLEQAERLFGAMSEKAAKPFEPPQHRPRESRYVHIPTAKPTTAVVIGYGPGLERSNPDYPAMTVMTGVLSSFPVGWLDRALRGEGQGLVYAVGAGVTTGAIRGFWSVLFNTQYETLEPALAQALTVVDRVRTETVDDVTLARARQSVLVEEAFGRQSYSQIAATAALDELYGLGYDHSDEEIEEIRKVSASDVREVAQKYLRNPIGAILSNQPPDLTKLPPLR